MCWHLQQRNGWRESAAMGSLCWLVRCFKRAAVVGATAALLSHDTDEPLASACVIAFSSSRAPIATAPWRSTSTATLVVTIRERQLGHSIAIARRFVGLVLGVHRNDCDLDQAADQTKKEHDGECEQLVHGGGNREHGIFRWLKETKKAPVPEHGCLDVRAAIALGPTP